MEQVIIILLVVAVEVLWLLALLVTQLVKVVVVELVEVFQLRYLLVPVQYMDLMDNIILVVVELVVGVKPDLVFQITMEDLAVVAVELDQVQQQQGQLIQVELVELMEFTALQDQVRQDQEVVQLAVQV